MGGQRVYVKLLYLLNLSVNLKNALKYKVNFLKRGAMRECMEKVGLEVSFPEGVGHG